MGCQDNDAENGKALEAVTVATSALYQAIDSDPGTWLTNAATGKQVNGVLNGASGGTLEAHGWRNTGQQETPEGFHDAYAERLSLNLQQFGQSDVVLTGNLLLTRHHLDYGPAGGTSITEVSRATYYRGQVLGSGSITGSFDIDVHGFAAGTVEWSCGTINDEGYGQGSCY
jgi:hypothetical protein